MSGETEYLRKLLPTEISVVETQELAPLESLLVAERAAVAAAVPKRAGEFATGRQCARQAMARIGIHGFALLPDANRAPQWPSEVVGSITHTDGFCAAAVGHRHRFLGVGIDAEIDGRVGTELWPSLFAAEEIHWLDRLPVDRRATMATVLFSAKESFFKAQYSFTNAWLDFQAATVRVEHDFWSLNLVRPEGVLGRLGLPVSGRFAIYDRLVVTAVFIESVPEPDKPGGYIC